MDVTFALLADAANIGESYKLNVLGIFDVISAEEFPAMQEKLTLAMKLECTPAEYGQEKELVIVLLKDDDQAPMITLKATIKLPRPDQPNIEIMPIFDIGNLRFDAPGHYAFHIMIGGETKKTIPFRVVKKEPDGTKKS